MPPSPLKKKNNININGNNLLTNEMTILKNVPLFIKEEKLIIMFQESKKGDIPANPYCL